MRAVFQLTLASLAVLGLLAVSCGTGGVAWNGQDPVVAELPQSRDPVLREAQLIEVTEVAPLVQIDLRYQYPGRISSKPLYQPGMKALLRPETAVRLRRASQLLKKSGYRLKVWDAWRSPSAQWALFEASGRNEDFVANPRNAPSQHSCGTAVDVTLVSWDGKEVEMPTPFDFFGPEAAAQYAGAKPEVIARRKILQQAMLQAGFYPLSHEWWHFVDRNYKNYPETIAMEKVAPTLRAR